MPALRRPSLPVEDGDTPAGSVTEVDQTAFVGGHIVGLCNGPWPQVRYVGGDFHGSFRIVEVIDPQSATEAREVDVAFIEDGSRSVLTEVVGAETGKGCVLGEAVGRGGQRQRDLSAFQ